MTTSERKKEENYVKHVVYNCETLQVMNETSIEFLNKQINAARTEANRGENGFAPWASPTQSQSRYRQSSQLDFRPPQREIFRGAAESFSAKGSR